MKVKYYLIEFLSYDQMKTGLNAYGYWTGKTYKFGDIMLPYCTPEPESITKRYPKKGGKKEAVADAMIIASNQPEYISGFYVIAYSMFKFSRFKIQLCRRSKLYETNKKEK